MVMSSRLPNPGDTLDLTISDLDSEGRGVGRWSGVVVFVPGALPGDRIKAAVRRTRTKTARARSADRGFAEADLVSVEEAGPGRVTPPCPQAAACGGCQLLSLAYPAQLEWKTRVVWEALRRVGHLGSVDVKPCLGAPHPLGYRNKAQFPVVAAYRADRGRARPRTPGRSGRFPGRRPVLVAGLYRRGTHEVVPVETCLLQHPVNNTVLAAATRLAAELGVEAHDEDTGRGLLRHILARVSSDGREAMAVLVTSRVAFPVGRRLAVALRRAVPQVKTVVQNVNTRRTNVILGPRNIVLDGPGFITDRLAGLAFRVSASSFFQVNPEQAEVLYGVAARMADGAHRAADVYCGVGTITLYLAKNLAGLDEIVGVESNPAAVRDAAANARANGVGNAAFVRGDAAAVLKDMAVEPEPPDTVVLDPPRKGCDPGVLEALATMGRKGCRRVIYVSCNPATLARDLAVLTGAGFEVTEVQPVDMFPQTTHVEAVAFLRPSCPVALPGAYGGNRPLDGKMSRSPA